LQHFEAFFKGKTDIQRNTNNANLESLSWFSLDSIRPNRKIGVGALPTNFYPLKNVFFVCKMTT
jgi:hypothetical protein